MKLKNLIEQNGLILGVFEFYCETDEKIFFDILRVDNLNGTMFVSSSKALESDRISLNLFIQNRMYSCNVDIAKTMDNGHVHAIDMNNVEANETSKIINTYGGITLESKVMSFALKNEVGSEYDLVVKNNVHIATDSTVIISGKSDNAIKIIKDNILKKNQLDIHVNNSRFLSIHPIDVTRISKNFIKITIKNSSEISTLHTHALTEIDSAKARLLNYSNKE